MSRKEAWNSKGRLMRELYRPRMFVECGRLE